LAHYAERYEAAMAKSAVVKKMAGKKLVVALGLMAGWVGMTALAGAQMPEGPGEGAPGAFTGGQMVRGTVTAVAAEQITIKTEAGDVYQVALSANTRMMKARQPVKVADVKVGDGIGAMGVLDAPAKTVHALMVAVMDAEDVKKAREGMGKLYIAGKVTAIDDVKLTIQRADGVSQVIEVDEGTSFKRGGRGLRNFLNGGVGGMGMGGGGGQGGEGAAGGPRPGAGPGGAGPGGGGESITLADVKVGDTVAGPGSVKNGVFVPTELGVMDPAAMQQRRRRVNPDGSNGPGAGPGSAKGSPSGSAPGAGNAPADAPFGSPAGPK
jgi:Cu/Ag efflux protein CusF